MAPKKPQARASKVKLPTPKVNLSVSPQMERNLRFFGVAAGVSLLVFVVAGFTLTANAPEANGFVLALLLGPAVGVTAARFLYGWPRFETKAGKPIVSPRARPYLFFPLAFVLSVAFYLVLGVFLGPVLPIAFVVYLPLAGGIAAGAGVSFFLVGFPPLVTEARALWGRVPTEHRPWLFLPLAVFFGLVLYFLVGVGLSNTPLPPNAQPLVALPLGFGLGATAAYFLVGVPKPKKPVREYVPEVPGRARPLAFAVTFLLAGLPLSFLAGLALSLVPNFPHAALLPLALLAGYSAALGVAAAAWGTPKRWRKFADYKPGLPEGARLALFVPAFVACTVAGAVAAFAAGVDMLIGIVVGSALGVVLGLRVSGAWERLRRARGESPTLLPELPDMVKPLVAFPAWVFVSGFLFFMLTYALPNYANTHFLVSAIVGLVVAVALVEEPTIREWLAERSTERARVAELAARRKAALARVAGDAPTKKKA